MSRDLFGITDEEHLAIIEEHYRNPRLVGHFEFPDYKHHEYHSHTGSAIVLQARLKDGKFNFRHRTGACVLIKASTSLLLETLDGHNEATIRFGLNKMRDYFEDVDYGYLPAALEPFLVVKGNENKEGRIMVVWNAVTRIMEQHETSSKL